MTLQLLLRPKLFGGGGVLLEHGLSQPLWSPHQIQVFRDSGDQFSTTVESVNTSIAQISCRFFRIGEGDVENLRSTLLAAFQGQLCRKQGGYLRKMGSFQNDTKANIKDPHWL